MNSCTITKCQQKESTEWITTEGKVPLNQNSQLKEGVNYCYLIALSRFRVAATYSLLLSDDLWCYNVMVLELSSSCNKLKLEILWSNKTLVTNSSYSLWINTSYEMKICSCFAVQSTCHTFCTIANNDNSSMLIEIRWVNYIKHLGTDR